MNKDHVDLVRFINGVLEKMRADGVLGEQLPTWLAPTLGKVARRSRRPESTDASR